MKFRIVQPSRPIATSASRASEKCSPSCPGVDCWACQLKRRVLDVVAPFDRAAPLGSKSPLVEENAIETNVLLVGPWPVVSSHIRQALCQRNLTIAQSLEEGQLFGNTVYRFAFNFTSDFEIMKAFFADKYAGGERVPHYSLLVDDSYQLVIIRVGRASRNSMLPERLVELIEFRLDKGKPTWVVTDKAWDQSNPVWSPELAETLAGFSVFEPEPEARPPEKTDEESPP